MKSHSFLSWRLVILYLSTDRGDTWTYLSGRDSLSAAFFATNSQGHIFAGTVVANNTSGHVFVHDNNRYLFRVAWNASGHASGVYLYRLQAGEFIETKKLTLLK